MSETPMGRHELVVRVIAQTAVDNEKYFCELDAVVGDGDFGYSLARGFEVVLGDWDALEYSDPSGLLKKTAIVLTQAHRRHLRADLGYGVPARRRRLDGRSPSPPSRRSSACCGPRSKGSSSAGTGPRRQDAARRPRAGRRRARGPVGREPALGVALERAPPGPRQRRGDPGDAREARAGGIHRRAQPRLWTPARLGWR